MPKQTDTINNYKTSNPVVEITCNARSVITARKEGYEMKSQVFISDHTPPRQQLKIIMKALHCLRQAPDLRDHKIQPVATALRNKTYYIDRRKLADCLITGLLMGCL